MSKKRAAADAADDAVLGEGPAGSRSSRRKERRLAKRAKRGPDVVDAYARAFKADEVAAREVADAAVQLKRDINLKGRWFA